MEGEVNGRAINVEGESSIAWKGSREMAEA